MRFVLATARKDLQRIRRDWPALLLWMGIPLMVGGLLVLMFGGESNPTAELLVVDHDQSLAGRLVTGAFQQGPLAEIVDVEVVALDEGRRRIDEGDASGLLVIPEGFGRAVLDGEPARLELLTNPSETVLPGILEETLDLTLEGGEVLRRLFDEPIDRIAADTSTEESPADTAMVTIATAFSHVGDRAGTWLLPPAIELETVSLAEAEEFDFARAFFPGMLVLAVLFMATGLSTDIWTERRLGTLRRAVTAPPGTGATVAGKWVAGGAALALVSAVGLAAGRWVFGIELANPLLAFLWLALVGVGLLALFTVVQLLPRSERAANVLVNTITLPLAMLGGSFFPFEAMPDWMVAVGTSTPNGWALLRLREILDGAADPEVLATSAAAAAAIVVVLGWLVARRMRGWAA